jgi:hypothetical protein
MRDDPISTLSLIAEIAGNAIERERERRRETGVMPSSERTEALLLSLTFVKRLARGSARNGAGRVAP